MAAKVLKKSYRLTALTLALLVSNALFACMSQESIPVPAPTPTVLPTAQPVGRGAGAPLRLLYWQAPNILNPHLTAANNELEIARIVYEPLASFDRENTMVLFLAAEEPTLDNGGVAPDGKSVTWKLKRGIKWSDGEPFTADDVLFTYEFITNPAVSSSSLINYESIESVNVIDDYTVKINFKEVNPAWAVPFVGLQGGILPRHVFNDFNGPNITNAPANTMPIGTGPYRVIEPGIKPQEVLFLGTELIQTVKIEFEPNPYFREQDKPFFSKIILRGGGTENEAARQVLAEGSVDYSYNLQLEPQVLDEMVNSGAGEVVANFGARVELVFLNHTDPNTEVDGVVSSSGTSHPFFKDIRVRQAFAYAIDHAAIADIYGSTGVATSNILVVPANYVSPYKYFEFDPNKARALLEEAGWVDADGDGIREKDGVNLKIVTRAQLNALQDKSQRIIRDNLRQIGVDVEIDLQDSGIYLSSDPAVTAENIFRFTADLQSIDISSESPDPGTYMNYWVCSQIPQKSNGWSGINLGRWCNPAYDEMFRQSTVEIDPEKRKELFIKMNDLMVQDVAVIPLVHLAKVSGVKSDIKGVYPTPWDAELWNVKDWSRTKP